MAIIAVDFDHTLWDTPNQVPLPGARDAMSRLHELGHTVIIHSCNSPEWIGLCLRNYDIWYDEISMKEDGKPIASVYIDDKALRFEGDWAKTLEDTLKYVE